MCKTPLTDPSNSSLAQTLCHPMSARQIGNAVHCARHILYIVCVTSVAHVKSATCLLGSQHCDELVFDTVIHSKCIS